MAFGEFAEVNPKRRLAKNGVAKFVPMAHVLPHDPKIVGFEQRPPEGSGARFQNGDTLFARITPCTENGKVAFVDSLDPGEVAFGSTEFIVLGPREGISVPKYVYYLASSGRVRSRAIRRMLGTSGRQRVPDWVFSEELDVLAPPVEEQVRIAEVLGAVDEAIERARAALDQARTVHNAVIRALLVRGAPGRCSQFKAEPWWGALPTGWRCADLGEFFADGPQNGIYVPESRYGDGTPIIRINDFAGGDVISRTPPNRVRLAATDVTTSVLRPGDLLVNRVNSVDHLGKCALIGHLPEKTVCESNLMRLAVDASRLRPAFVLLVLGAFGARRQMRAAAKRAVAQASIDQGDVARVKVPVPTVAEQDEITRVADAMLDRCLRAEAWCAAVAGLKASLADRLLTGADRASGAARAAARACLGGCASMVTTEAASR